MTAELRPFIQERFAPNLLSKDTRSTLNKSYAASQPYKHAVVDALINDDLLRAAREEIISELSFTEKETDIYKVNQTGDLANLDGLPQEEAAKLKSLLKVRDAIYSLEFRQWLQDVTGCGPLSEKKKDMSINDYRHGCHLLNHDDVIATRRVSYILYLPDPEQPWQPEWGGALELYPVKESKEEGVAREPENIPSVSIPPRWNQYNFFAVQPGHSFHSVEEVAHPTASRLSISGWFHRPQPDEPGFDKDDEAREERERKEHASAEGLSSKRAAASFISYPEEAEPPLPGSQMTQEDVNFLRPFLNPAYLAPRTQSQLFEKFGDDSHVLLSEIFNSKVAAALEKGLKSRDDKDGFRWWKKGKGEEGITIPDQKAGVDADWDIVGPPHRQRYLSLRPNKPATDVPTSNPASAIPNPLPLDSPSDLLDILRTHVLPSPAFRHFLANISQLVPISHRPFEARRFRPGLDYTLARSDEEPVLDVCFGLTPDMARVAMDAAGGGAAGPKGLASSSKFKKPKTTSTSPRAQLSKKQAKELAGKWESGEIGGWSCYMAPDEEDDDATGEVYRQGGAKSKAEAENEAAQAVLAEDANGTNGNDEDDDDEDEDDEDGEDEEEDEDFDGVLLNLTPSFNTLSIALRDEGVLHFVKYLGSAAGGSRWDVVAEYGVGAVEEEDDDEEEVEA